MVGDLHIKYWDLDRTRCERVHSQSLAALRARNSNTQSANDTREISMSSSSSSSSSNGQNNNKSSVSNGTPEESSKCELIKSGSNSSESDDVSRKLKEGEPLTVVGACLNNMYQLSLVKHRMHSYGAWYGVAHSACRSKRVVIMHCEARHVLSE